MCAWQWHYNYSVSTTIRARVCPNDISRRSTISTKGSNQLFKKPKLEGKRNSESRICEIFQKVTGDPQLVGYSRRGIHKLPDGYYYRSAMHVFNFGKIGSFHRPIGKYFPVSPCRRCCVLCSVEGIWSCTLCHQLIM